MRHTRGFSTILFSGPVIAGLTSLALTVLEAQPNQFQFILGATDASGAPVTDLEANEVVVTENGAAATILKIEPYTIPVKLTVGVGNGPDSHEAKRRRDGRSVS